MFGFKKHCPICGMDVNSKSTIKRFGKHFCSNTCVEKYLIYTAPRIVIDGKLEFTGVPKKEELKSKVLRN